MKKFFTLVMSLLLVGLTCMLVYVVLNPDVLNLNWNDILLSSEGFNRFRSAPVAGNHGAGGCTGRQPKRRTAGAANDCARFQKLFAFSSAQRS